MLKLYTLMTLSSVFGIISILIVAAIGAGDMGVIYFLLFIGSFVVCIYPIYLWSSLCLVLTDFEELVAPVIDKAECFLRSNPCVILSGPGMIVIWGCAFKGLWAMDGWLFGVILSSFLSVLLPTSIWVYSWVLLAYNWVITKRLELDAYKASR